MTWCPYIITLIHNELHLDGVLRLKCFPVRQRSCENSLPCFLLGWNEVCRMAPSVARWLEWQTWHLVFSDGQVPMIEYWTKEAKAPLWRGLRGPFLFHCKPHQTYYSVRWASLQKDSQESAVAFLQSIDQAPSVFGDHLQNFVNVISFSTFSLSSSRLQFEWGRSLESLELA